MESEEATPDEPTSLEQLLDRLCDAKIEEQKVSIDAILDSVGVRSFGAILLFAGIIVLAPLLGDIPGMPTLMATVVLLTAGQLLIRRDHIWLPSWLLKRSVKKKSLNKAVKLFRRPARFLDKLTRQRLQALFRKPGVFVISLVCVLIALMMPPMELIPFSANGAGLALTAFGLSLIARDGLLAVLALAVTGGTVVLVVFSF